MSARSKKLRTGLDRMGSSTSRGIPAGESVSSNDPAVSSGSDPVGDTPEPIEPDPASTGARIAGNGGSHGRGNRIPRQTAERSVRGDPVRSQSTASRSLAAMLEIDEGVNRLAEAREIALDHIHPNPDQPRQTFDDASLRELAASIREQGVLQPITVVSDDEGFRIVAGERRWRAARIAGLRRIPALVRDLSERDQTIISLMENLQREDLNDIDRARGLARLKEVMGTQVPDLRSHELDETVGERLGISGRAVRNFVALLQLPPAIQERIASGGLTEKHGRALRRLRSPGLQRQAAEVATRTRLTGDETVRLVRSLQTNPDSDIDALAWRVKAGEVEMRVRVQNTDLPGKEEHNPVGRVADRIEEQAKRLEVLAVTLPSRSVDAKTIDRLEALSRRIHDVAEMLARGE